MFPNFFIFHTSLVDDYLDKLLEHYHKLSKDDIYNRFFHFMTDESIKSYLINLKYKHGFFVCVNDYNDFAIVANIIINSNSKKAELSISTIPEFRNKHLSKQTLEFCLSLAKNLSIKKVYFSSLKDNNCHYMFKSLNFVCSSIGEVIEGYKVL